jgi:hypothetical protein
MKIRIRRTAGMLMITGVLLLSAQWTPATLHAEHMVPQDGLVAYWSLDEGSGSTASEQTGVMAGRTLSVLGASTWVDGKYGKAFYFDGNTVLAMDGASAIKAYNITVSFWAKIDDFPTSDTGANLMVVNADLAALDKGAFDFGFFGKGLYAYVVNSFSGGTGDRVSHGVDISSQIQGKWQHFAAVFNTDEGAEYAKLYLNGAEIASSTLRSILGLQIKLGYPKTAAYKKCALNFGGYTDTSGVVQRAIKGAMDDIAIYDRALNPAEIGQLAGIAPTPTLAASSTTASSAISSNASSSTPASSLDPEDSSTTSASTESPVESGSRNSESAGSDSGMSQSGTGSDASSTDSSAVASDGDDDPAKDSNVWIIVLVVAGAAVLAGGIGWLVLARKK